MATAAPAPAPTNLIHAAVQAVPQRAAEGDSAEFVGMPAERIEVGSIVAIHAQGKVRGVVVTKVTAKRVTAEWTTPSRLEQQAKLAGIDDATKSPWTVSKSVKIAEVYAVEPL